jgi:hypothetical protein
MEAEEAGQPIVASFPQTRGRGPRPMAFCNSLTHDPDHQDAKLQKKKAEKQQQKKTFFQKYGDDGTDY